MIDKDKTDNPQFFSSSLSSKLPLSLRYVCLNIPRPPHTHTVNEADNTFHVDFLPGTLVVLGLLKDFLSITAPTLSYGSTQKPVLASNFCILVTSLL